MRNIDFKDIETLCKEFGVEFKTEIDPDDNKIIFYCFGEVRWGKDLSDFLNWEDYLRISMHLSATYPEKILGKGY